VLLHDSVRMVRLCPGHDLNWQQFSLLAGNVPPDLLEVVLHQHMPLFHTRHCLFAAHLSNEADCAHCGRPCNNHEIRLRDRIGVSHPVHVDLAGRNTVFSARPQTAAEYVPAMLQLGLRHFRMECLGESADDARALLDVYAALLAGQFDPRATLDRLRQFSPTGITAGTFAHA
jgi:putative protease